MGAVGRGELDLDAAQFKELDMAEIEAVRGSDAEHARLGVFGFVLGGTPVDRFGRAGAGVLHAEVSSSYSRRYCVVPNPAYFKNVDYAVDNYLLNIGSKGDGSIPEGSVRVLREVGEWLQTNGHTVFESDVCRVHSNYASYTSKGNTLYMHVFRWPGDYVAISGLQTKVKSAKLLITGEPVAFEQEEFRVRFTGLPVEAPQYPLTTIQIEFDTVPKKDMIHVRETRPCLGV